MLYTAALVKDPEIIKCVYEFVKGQNLNYPQYDQWAIKCYDEMVLSYKKAFAATLKRDGKPFIIGSIIAQKDKKDASVLELKNGRVRKEFKTRKIFKSLYSEVEKYARENGYKKIQLDVHAGMDDVVQVMTKMGFTIEARENLYSTKQLELIMTKDLTIRNTGLVSIVADAKKLIKLMESLILKIKYLLLNDFSD